jgi:hypothetical protein
VGYGQVFDLGGGGMDGQAVLLLETGEELISILPVALNGELACT